MIRYRNWKYWMGVGALVLLPGTASQGATVPVSYNRDIRPILSDNCFFCHGPDQSKRKAKLRLDVRAEALKKAIVPGQPDASELIKRILSSDEDEVMPPPKSHKKLSAPQKDLLRRWIADGAEYQGHWAYVRPIKPAAPEGAMAIDTLVRQRLQEIGLEASPVADRRTLLRRLSLDLVGLPPTPEAVAKFEADRSPRAYEKIVEEPLSSPHYGERMAIGWLDVVRFADTIGYHSDNPRNIWPYRDYVIHAFNSDKPFDRFTQEQLAGDLLPNSSTEQKVASGFNRLLLSTEEGGAQPKDYEARMLTDRVRAVSAVWLGQTIGCAQCHDHKFDPITSRDFYSLGAFFADIQEPIIGRREDGILVPTEQQSAKLDRLSRQLDHWRTQYDAPRSQQLTAWERAALEAVRAEQDWVALLPEEATAEVGAKLSVDLQGVITAEKDSGQNASTYRIKLRPPLSGLAGLRVEALTSDKLPNHGPGRASDGGFTLSQVELERGAGDAIELADATATFAGSTAWRTVLPLGHSSPGWAVSGLPGVPQAIYLAAQQPIEAADETALTLVIHQPKGAALGRFKISATANPAAVRAPATTLPPAEIRAILAQAPAERTADQTSKLAAYHRTIAPELAELRQQLAAAQKAKDDFEASLPHCLVSVSMEKPRTVRILPRGNWMVETGDIVQPALPAYLAGAQAEDRRLNRLDLANWLVSPENPLTARVTVNRLWKQFFGMGLSKVLDDFGAQGEPPPNQALLDWLACEFVESGWDVKHMVRLIVTSQAYQQVSTASKELQARDPYNRELARQSRWRLEAELVRDNALSIAGLLVPKVGGPSVKPYQPEGYWENLNFPVRTYEASTGEDQYRRGVYTWWQRSYLHPSLIAFDAPTREECAAERGRSNIPQQALVLLNDPTYVEAARVFAARILEEGGSDVLARVNWAWQQALDRLPRPDELQTVQALLYKELAEYKKDNAAADALLRVGQKPVPSDLSPAELAAWTSVARVLLNLHETITRS